MRSVFVVLLLLAPACSFPVDDFVVSDGGDAANPGDAGTTTSTPTTPPTSSSTAPSSSTTSSTTPDAGDCVCVERDDKDPTKCKRWVPDKCGETGK